MALLLSRLVPQADSLADIVRTVEAVAAGSTDFQGIAAHIGKVDRQGRYYRMAAESMDLLRNTGNRSVLTPLGEAVAAATGKQRNQLINRAVLQNPVVREALVLLDAARSSGLSRQELAGLIRSKTTATGSTSWRRAATLSSWLLESGYASQRGGRLVGRAAPGEAFAEVADDLGFPVSPLTAKPPSSSAAAGGSLAEDPLTFSVDQVKRERANIAHAELIDMMANNIRRRGATPRTNRFVDLATEAKGKGYLFEMKSATAPTYHSQIRRGVSQLYEYAYIQQLPASTLCLVMEISPPSRKRWLVEYLVDARNVQICWKAGRDKFDCPPACEPSIGMFL